MGKPTGFMEFGRELPRRRPVRLRIRDWHEVYEPFDPLHAQHQGARCMDCGIPFCHEGCPLGNLIPEWNDLVWQDDWSTAIERLHATNNFPEFTGRLCPAPCEAACVLGINADPVTIERIEYEIAERAFAEGWVTRQLPRERTGKRVAVIGSGPAGLACAQQLARAGHEVVVYERAEKPGGLLRYGIPEFKMEKRVLDRRLAQLVAEGIGFRCSTLVGLPPADPPEGSLEPGLARGLGTACGPEVEVVSAVALAEEFDALVLAGGATVPRDLAVSGRALDGVHFAMDYLKPSNLVRERALAESPIDAKGRRVVIIGGGDTGADCLGTAHRQGAASVVQLEILPEPPGARPDENPWPTWPRHPAQLRRPRGGRAPPVRGVDDRARRRRHRRGWRRCAARRSRWAPTAAGRPSRRSRAASSSSLADLVLAGARILRRRADTGWSASSASSVGPTGHRGGRRRVGHQRRGVFVCGDMTRGQSLIVWAIAEGRSAAPASTAG